MMIVLSVHHFPPRYSAGAELYTYRLAHWLLKHGHKVEVVCVEAIDVGQPGELRTVKDMFDGVTVWRLSFNLYADKDPDRAAYDDPSITRWFAAYLDQRRPDIVHSQGGYLLGVAPLEAAHAAEIPSVLTLHDYWFLCPRITLQRGDGGLCRDIPDDPAQCAWCCQLASRRYRIPDRLTAGAARVALQQIGLGGQRDAIAERRARVLPVLALPDAVIAPSRFLAERYASHVATERLRLVPLGIDLTRFQTARKRTEDRMLRIGFIGQIAPHKGVHLLIKAFHHLRAHHRPIELHIYGSLEMHPEYVARLRRLATADGRVHFHGRYENVRVAEILSGVDVTVVPSVWFENSPLTIRESHAAGTPVVTARLGGMAEMVRNEVDGLHFRPADDVDLRRQLQRLIDDPDLLPRLRSGITVPHALEEEMRQLMEIYEQVLRQPTVQEA